LFDQSLLFYYIVYYSTETYEYEIL